MQLMQTKEVRLALGLLGAGSIVYALFRLWKIFLGAPAKERDETKQTEQDENEEDEEDHVPFEEFVTDRHGKQMGYGRVQQLKYLRDIAYRVIFCLMKGNAYQGIVTISFQLGTLSAETEKMALNFRGTGVKFLQVNGRRFDRREVEYLDHCISLPRAVLREGGKNNIEVIFENNYSFLNEGLAAYFVVDQNQKYSLRQQVIFSAGGYLEVERVFPCFNCLNECRVQVQVIHPDTFEVFSNAAKSLQRFCSVTEYQKYPFLFDLASNSLNRSFRLNSSSVSSSSIGDTSSQYSSSNFYNRKKANTHFYPAHLLSIHNIFLASSALLELIPQSLGHPLEDLIMVRYFCKHADSHRIERSLGRLHAYVFDVMKKLPKVEKAISKLDILIISDAQSEGHFAPGALLLCEKSIAETINIRCFYLIARALMGLTQLANGDNIVTIQQTTSLNEKVFAFFEEFRSYVYLANIQLQPLRALLGSAEQREYVLTHEGFILKYYVRELRFLIRKEICNQVPPELKNLVSSLKSQTAHQFWEKLSVKSAFLSPAVVESLLEVALKHLGAPVEQRIRDQLKIALNSSKYVLGLYSDVEISDNLPKFMERESQGLEERLPKLKVKQKFKEFITERYEKYLPVKSNIAEAEAIYNQFKKFNQAKNFHHLTLLTSEVKRVQCFGKGFIKPEQIESQCSVAGWKLLSRLKIYPMDESYYRFLKVVDDVEEL